MPAVYFKVKCDFDIINSENKEKIITQLENINPNSLDIQAIKKDGGKIAFHAEINDIKSGEIYFEKEGDFIKVKSDAIFKINVRPQHVADVIDSETQWYCNGIEEFPGNKIIGTITGLEQEKYKWKNFQGEGESVRYKIHIKVGNKIKDLSSDAVGDRHECYHVEEATSSDLLKMSNYYNLRFGYCNAESEGDFIDNIAGKFNIYVADGHDENLNVYLCLYINNEFKVIENGSIHGNLDLLSKHLSTLFSKNIAKGLIQSGYDNDPDGIIDNAPDYEEHYFDTREDDDVDGYMPCFFVVSSVTYDCNCKIDKNSGAVQLDGKVIDNMYDFYGYLDEDESYAIGVVDYENN